MVWNVLRIYFGFQPPTSVANLFGSWLRGFPLKLRKQILIGASALCWALWLCGMMWSSNAKKPNSFLQVLFRETFWIRNWSVLSKEEERDSLKKGCQTLEFTVMEVFSKAEWNFRQRIKN